MILTRVFEFEAVHHIVKGNGGKGEKIHVHTYKLIVKVEGTINNEGRVLDFVKFKDIVNENVIKELNHAYVNDIIKQPSAENTSKWIWNKLVGLLKGENYRLYEIEVWKTPTAGATYGLKDAEANN